MMHPQGLVKAQLTNDQCAFYAHPTYPNTTYVITSVYTASDPLTYAYGEMYTPEGVALLGFTAYCIPSTAVGLYMWVSIDGINSVVGYWYMNANGWSRTLHWTYPAYGLDRTKKHTFQVRASVSSSSLSATLYHGGSAWGLGFWGIGRGFTGKEWNLTAQKEFVG